ncbi:endonuclease/exonuclease/phosphatase family protein [Micromonospora sp. NPDC050200]|uniref:endonuclease/exonuclease/phosphatase family protein n=1 Tax=Micromonospora sp. NPDC050200 TaxID=3155664 RepID=UPI003403D67F
MRTVRLRLATTSLAVTAIAATILVAPAPALAAPTTIHAVQGTTRKSPLSNTTVTVTGIVTAIRSGAGFWIQDANPDGDSRTSEGLYVYTGATPKTAVGNKVTVTGRVSEFYPGGSSAGGQSITELTSASWSTVSTGNPLPAPVALTDALIPNAYTATGNLESLTLNPSAYALDLFASLEGMRVEVGNARVVGPTTPYNELWVTAKPNQNSTPRGGTVYGSYSSQNSGRVKVKSLLASTFPQADVGDVLTGATTGPLDYDQFGGYLIAATSLGTLQDNRLAGEQTAAQAADQLAIATYNVENLDPTDPQSKFDRLAAGIVANLRSPDVVALEEMQDNSGPTDDGVVAADRTFTKLINAIIAAGGPSYGYRQINPQNGQDGGEPGGNIRVGFLFNPARVAFTDRPGGTATAATTVVNNGGKAQLSYSPGRISPTDSNWSATRKPLAGEFTFQGQTVIVIANHFSSKGGDQPLYARVQPPTRSSETKRQAQASIVNTFVKQILSVQPTARVVVLGDINDFEFSTTMANLVSGTSLTDLVTTLPAGERYSYVYDGNSQVLDHICISSSFTAYDYDVLHVNAEFADRASDHDPQVVRVRV